MIPSGKRLTLYGADLATAGRITNFMARRHSAWELLEQLARTSFTAMTPTSAQHTCLAAGGRMGGGLGCRRARPRLMIAFIRGDCGRLGSIGTPREEPPYARLGENALRPDIRQPVTATRTRRPRSRRNVRPRKVVIKREVLLPETQSPSMS
jgi:hypothetical protein